MAIGSALSVGLIGLKAFIVQIQAFVSPGLPYFSIIGLPDTSLSEARERVKSACQASGFKWPETRVTVNLSPASMPKKGSSHDLAIAASVLSAAGAIAHDCLAGTIVLGEVNLDGTVLPINGLLPIMLHAREQGIATIIVPYANLDEARLVPDVKAICVRHVGELIELMGGDADYRIPEATHAVNADVGATGMCPPPGDMSEVMGQQAAKWALEVAAAGGHHLMMTGPPGTGKTMLASRIPGIMSPLNETEQLEVASIRSLCGTLPGYGISDVRGAPPYRVDRRAGGWRRGIGPARSHHPRASRHPVHGRGSGILGAYAADAARTFGIRICRDFQSERHHILSGSLPTDYGGESLPVRLRVRQRRALHLPRKGPRQVFQPAFRTDPRPYRHPDRGASGGADKSGERSLRRFEPCHTSACHRCPADGAGTVPRIRLVLQRAGYRHLAESQHLPQGHRIGQPRLGERAAEPAWRRPCHAACVDIIRSGGKDFPRT